MLKASLWKIWRVFSPQFSLYKRLSCVFSCKTQHLLAFIVPWISISSLHTEYWVSVSRSFYALCLSDELKILLCRIYFVLFGFSLVSNFLFWFTIGISRWYLINMRREKNSTFTLAEGLLLNLYIWDISYHLCLQSTYILCFYVCRKKELYNRNISDMFNISLYSWLLVVSQLKWSDGWTISQDFINLGFSSQSFKRKIPENTLGTFT